MLVSICNLSQVQDDDAAIQDLSLILVYRERQCFTLIQKNG